jgi:hypothetical protein
MKMPRSHREAPPPDQLRDLVARIIEMRRGQPRISPGWVATEAMHDLDRNRTVEHDHPTIWLGCHLQLRQIARQLLAQRFEQGEEEQHLLFKDLQWRYPTARSANAEEREYLLRDLMSDEDIAYNVGRLRAEALAKMYHADALEAWGRDRGEVA